MNTDYTVYGIKNCDTLKKARRYLDLHQINYRFHDYRVDGLSSELLQTFLDQLDWQSLLNSRGTTWRQLSEETRAMIQDQASAKQLMLTAPAMIKRPLLVHTNRSMLLGFSSDSYAQFIEANK